MPWLIISNAAGGSKRSSMTTFLWSMANKMSFWTLTKAVSVLCPFLYPDWKGSYIPLALRYAWSWEATTRSSNLEMKLRLEMGLYFFTLALLHPRVTSSHTQYTGIYRLIRKYMLLIYAFANQTFRKMLTIWKRMIYTHTFILTDCTPTQTYIISCWVILLQTMPIRWISVLPCCLHPIACKSSELYCQRLGLHHNLPGCV